jgi:pilus assembly protein Flp/PilA
MVSRQIPFERDLAGMLTFVQAHPASTLPRRPAPSDTMPSLSDSARRFLHDEEGATMIEYALIVAAIALVVVIGARTLGDSTSAKFNSAAGQLT